MKVDQQLNLTQTALTNNEETEGEKVLPGPESDRQHKSSPEPDAQALPHLSSSGAQKEGSLADTEELQDGVRNAEALAKTWNKSSLVTVYAFFWLTYAVNAFQSSITGNLSPFITSGFQSHSLIPTIGIVSNIMSAAAYMILAKVLNLWDRSYGYLGMTVIATIGLILSAVCKNIYTYCAAQCFYSVGFIGMIFAVDVFTADTSTLKNRGVAYAFTASPWIIVAYAGPKISERFYENNWRWAYGCFAIILPFVALPFFIFMQMQKRKAINAGEIVSSKSTRNWKESLWHYAVEFDVLGVFLICAGLSLFLLPFTIAQSAENSWREGYIIAMLVIGFVLLVSFGFVERYISPKPFIAFHLLANRTVLGACMLNVSWQIAYYCWYSYFTSFLQVVFDISIARAGYISSIYDVVAGVWLFPVGYLVRRTGYFKWLLYIGVPVYILGEGLMIYCRKPGQPLGLIVFTQILIAWAGSSFTLVEQIAVLAAGSHNDAAGMLALLGMFGYFAGAIGNSISGAIWTNTLPSALQQFLPAETLDQWEDIYESLDLQLSFPMGDPTRTAINEAYAEAQRRMLIAGTSIMALALFCVIAIKNIKVSEIEQVKGVVF
ncbi:uncharacterized protein I206_105751 [Kwoniella pini CBS 10737]|uniref:Siderophore iron transporter MirB n=1 Tax=Kwoniella pini CBS 10737 TaxID=1296096 RepID=A0A1B9I042_9TREE|nr:siderophore iron transporter MirB [Kwoniella pini CBS 10737]OCF48884.1 siderophore iron transporter MirB [Kwoniella pini CBS 10737]